MEKLLKDLRLGEQGEIAWIRADEEMRRRLLDIGFVPGSKVECVGVSPLKEPKAYLIRGAVIVLREEDSGNIGLKQ